MVVVSLQMLEQVQKHGIGCIAVKNVAVGILLAGFGFKNMGKQLLAKGFEQVFFGFKVRVKGGPAHIGFFYDLANGDLFVALSG